MHDSDQGMRNTSNSGNAEPLSGSPKLRRPLPRPTVPLRSSPSVWAAPLIVIAMIFCWYSVLGNAEPEPYLTGTLAQAGIGLQYGLPLAAGVAAWAARRSRILHPKSNMRTLSRSAFRIWWAHVWPIFTAIGVGYAATVLISLAGTPALGQLHLSVLLVYLSMAVVSVSLGWILGTILPVPIAVPLAIFLEAYWGISALADGDDLARRNMTGFATFMCCDFVEQTIDPRAVIAPLIIAVALLGVALLSIRVAWVKLAIPAILSIGIAGMCSTHLVSGTNATATVLRSSAEQVCSGENPEVCLYPEVPERERKLIATTLQQVYRAAAKEGMAFAKTIRQFAAEEPAGRNTLSVHISSWAESRDQILSTFASSLYDHTTCNPADPDPESEFQEDEVVPYALALVFGADSNAALPQWQILEGGEDGDVARPVPPEEIKAMLGVNSLDDATKAAKLWYQNQSQCGA